MRKYLVVSTVLILLLLTAGIAQASPAVILDGKNLMFNDVPPTIENGRTLVPLRTLFEALGADVQWDGNARTVTANMSGSEIKLIIGGQAYINGQPVKLDVPARIINGRTLAPLRLVAEAMGCQVSWDGITQKITINSSSGSAGSDDMIAVHFIDVGRGNAIYINLPDNNDILIDAGNVGDGQTVINHLHNLLVDDIELLIATSPQEDHIGGMPAIFNAFKIEKIIDSGKKTPSDIYKIYEIKAKAEGALWAADNRQTLTFGNATLQILTGPETWNDINDYSVVCRLDTGDVEFLFTGDVDCPAEVAIISDNANNSLDHPAEETVQRIKNAGIAVYQTDLNGDLIISTDGKTYTIKELAEEHLDLHNSHNHH